MPTITSPSNDPHNMKMSLLVIDDDPIVCELVERIAKNEGVAVQALQSAKNLTPQMLKGHKLVLLDLMMPETDGVQVMNVLKAAENPPKLILISGVGAQGLAACERLAQTKGLQVESLAKPFRAKQLADVLRKHFAIDQTPFRAKGTPTPHLAISSDELVQALQTNQMLVVFQPIVSVDSGECLCVEAIAHWHHPTRVVLEYKHFAHFLDDAQTALLFLNNVLLQTIQGYRTLALLAGYNGMTSVKMPARLFTDTAMVDKLFSVLKETAFDSSRLAIEMQDTELTQGLNTGLDGQTRLRLRSIQLQVGNFATDYVDLQHMKSSAFSVLKINISDQPFIKEKGVVPMTLASTLDMACKLGITVIATGVNVVEDCNLSRNMGFIRGQGNYVCAPMTADLLATWLNQPNALQTSKKKSCAVEVSGRILLVEDNPILQNMYGTFLLNHGFTVEYADDGIVGLDHMSKGGYSLVIMDGMMPKMDGIEATRRMRSLPDERSQVPVLALTAMSSGLERERFISAGINGFLTKPVRLVELLSEVQRLISQVPSPVNT